MKRALAFLVLVAAVVGACGGGNTAGTSGSPTATASASPTAKPIQVGLVTDVGGLNDKSFNQAANTGRLNAEKDFGLKTSVIESKKQEDYVPNVTTFAQQNYDLVISDGLLIHDAAWKVATQFPNVKFAIIDGPPADDAGNMQNLPDVANLFFKEQEAGYLVGVIA